VLGVHPVVVTLAVLAVDRLFSVTRDAGGDDEDGKRPEGRLDCDRDQERDDGGSVMTFPGKAVTFICGLGCRSSGLIIESSELVAALSAHRAVAGAG
jgi:hypothetical protein